MPRRSVKIKFKSESALVVQSANNYTCYSFCVLHGGAVKFPEILCNTFAVPCGLYNGGRKRENGKVRGIGIEWSVMTSSSQEF
jgi:hypothetical protein